MYARPFKGICLEKRSLQGGVLKLTLQPQPLFKYEPGQFISLVVSSSKKNSCKRLYSLATPTEIAKEKGLEIYVKLVPNGAGSQFLNDLKAGEEVKGFAPYGDFVYQKPSAGRQVCFIGGGTAVTPLQAIVMSKQFLSHRVRSLALLGFRSQEEIICGENFEKSGVKTTYCISNPNGPLPFNAVGGRVTDYLKTLPIDWPWKSTDFYICGNENMTNEVIQLLREGHGVHRKAIRFEKFNSLIGNKTNEITE